MLPSTQVEFTLPFGYQDEDGKLHQQGVLRLPTFEDLSEVDKVAGKVENARFRETLATKLILSRVLVSLGHAPIVEDRRIEIVNALVLPDVQYLNRELSRLWYGRPADDEIECPNCGHRWITLPKEVLDPSPTSDAP
jgi:hypothetical protein